MSEIRAMIVSARMEVFLPFPADVLEAVDRDTLQIATAISAMPDWARAVVGSYAEFSPHIAAFGEGLNWQAIRAEFARKAKKIGLIADHDVSFRATKTGFDMWCTAKGRA